MAAAPEEAPPAAPDAELVPGAAGRRRAWR